MERHIKKFPEQLIRNFEMIPDPEKESVLIKAGFDKFNDDFKPDEMDIASFDEAIRYKDAKIQLVKLMLEGKIEDDLGGDRVEAKEIALKLIKEYPMSQVIEVYEEKYSEKKN